MKYKKGFSLIMVFVIIVVIGIVAYGVYYFINNKSFFLTNTAEASVTVISPKNEEQWMVGTRQIIKWSSANIPEKETIGIQLANPDLNEDGF